MTSRSDPSLPDRSRDGIAVALLLLLFLVQWAGFVFRDRMFYFRDLSFFSAPLLVEVAQQWKTGHFPAWNPHLACGAPLAANPNAGVFLPDAVLVPLFGGWLEGVKILLLARLLFVSLAAYAALRATRISPAGAWLAAAAVSLSGPVATTLSSFPAHLFGAIVFLPLAAAGARLSDGSAGRNTFAASALLFALAILSGSPEIAVQAAILYLICSAARPWLRSLGRAVLALFCGTLIAAPLLVPAAGLYPRTPRGLGWRLSTAPGFLSFSPARLVEFLWPGVLGDPAAAEAHAYWGRSISNGSTPYLLSVAVGLLPWALLPLALRRPFGRRLAITAGLFMLLSFGGFLPGAEHLLHLPPFTTLRYPEKWQLGATLCLAALAGVGLDELRRIAFRNVSLPRAVAWAALALSAALGAAVRFAPETVLRAMRATGLLEANFPANAEDSVRRALEREALYGILVAAALLAILWLSKRPRLAPALPALLIGLLVAERLPRVIGSVPATSLAWFRAQRRVVAPVLLQQQDGRFFYDREATNEVEAFRPFTGTLFGLSYAGNTDVDQFSDARSRGIAETTQRLSFSDPRKVSLLRLANVRVVDTDDPAAAGRPELELFGEGSRGRRFYRLKDSAPARLFFRTAGFSAPGQVLGGMLMETFPLEEAAAVEGNSAASPRTGRHAVGALEWLAPDEFELDFETQQPAWLQLAVTFDPNWKLEIDGNPVVEAPSDLAYLGLAVPPGRHRLHAKYSDPRFLAGGAIAVATLAGLALVARRRPPAPTIG